MKMVGEMKNTGLLIGLLISVILLSAGTAMAGGCAPGQPCWEQFNKPRKKVIREPVRREEFIQERAPVEVPTPVPPLEEPVALDVESGDFGLGIAGGVNVLFLNCEDTAVAPSIMVDYQPDSELPLNIRTGVELGSIDGEQFFFTPESQFFQDKVDLSVVRIPVSLEYVKPVSEQTKLFFGGGPSLLVVTGDADNSGIDVDDTDVGWHLAARVQQQVTDWIAVSLEGGYMFAELDAEGEDLDLDSAFTGVHLVAVLD